MGHQCCIRRGRRGHSAIHKPFRNCLIHVNDAAGLIFEPDALALCMLHLKKNAPLVRVSLEDLGRQRYESVSARNCSWQSQQDTREGTGSTRTSTLAYLMAAG